MTQNLIQITTKLFSYSNILRGKCGRFPSNKKSFDFQNANVFIAQQEADLHKRSHLWA